MACEQLDLEQAREYIAHLHPCRGERERRLEYHRQKEWLLPRVAVADRDKVCDLLAARFGL